ncbi:MAG: hypothetical protein JXA33_25630 [Anaerolineae bacterium]|nr:hypothetical protein [Anaerolineae bacterium]
MKKLTTIFWRTVYGISEHPLVLCLVTPFIRLAARWGGEALARRLTKAITHFLLLTPPQHIGYVHLHLSRLYWLLRRQAKQPQVIPSQPLDTLQERPRKVGILGYFVGHGPKSLLDQFPDDVELYVFDVQTDLGYRAEWLQTRVNHYIPLLLRQATIKRPLLAGWEETNYVPLLPEEHASPRDLVAAAAESINQAALDLLMIIGHEREPHTYELVDLIETPCMVHICNSSDLLHHEKVSFYMYTQPQAGYYLKEKQLVCAATQAPFTAKAVYPAALYYDPRGIDLNDPLPTWTDRDPLIVFHGPLYKLGTSPVIDMIAQLLSDDSTLEFVFMGRLENRSYLLSTIEKVGKHYGVAARIHYAGNFLATWDASGSVVGPDWDKIISYLRRARLEPNPFPLGGGQARFQAYLNGVPSIHMGVQLELSHKWLKQDGLVEVPALLIPNGTAYSQKEYLDLCRRCLYDQIFADQLASEQFAVARAASDGSAYWQRLFDSYRDWMMPLRSKDHTQLHAGRK